MKTSLLSLIVAGALAVALPAAAASSEGHADSSHATHWHKVPTVDPDKAKPSADHDAKAPRHTGKKDTSKKDALKKDEPKKDAAKDDHRHHGRLVKGNDKAEPRHHGKGKPEPHHGKDKPVKHGRHRDKTEPAKSRHGHHSAKGRPRHGHHAASKSTRHHGHAAPAEHVHHWHLK